MRTSLGAAMGFIGTPVNMAVVIPSKFPENKASTFTFDIQSDS